MENPWHPLPERMRGMLPGAEWIHDYAVDMGVYDVTQCVTCGNAIPLLSPATMDDMAYEGPTFWCMLCNNSHCPDCVPAGDMHQTAHMHVSCRDAMELRAAREAARRHERLMDSRAIELRHREARGRVVPMPLGDLRDRSRAARRRERQRPPLALRRYAPPGSPPDN